MEAPIAEIKPNVKKAFVSNIFIVLLAVALIIGVLVYLNTIVGLDIFLDTLKEIGVIVSPLSLLLRLIFFILFFACLFLLLNFALLSKVSYTLYEDKIVYSKNFFIINIRDKAIPYSNIVKISFEKKPFLNTAKVAIELTGMREKKLEMDFIDNVEEVVKKIQDSIREQRARYYAKYTQDYRMQNIMDRLA